MSSASTITTITKETTMSNNKLWQQVVADYYKEANYYLVTEIA